MNRQSGELISIVRTLTEYVSSVIEKRMTPIPKTSGPQVILARYDDITYVISSENPVFGDNMSIFREKEFKATRNIDMLSPK